MFINHNHRRSIRLPQYNYSQLGAYYITICTWNREQIFGKIKGSIFITNEYGEIARREWIKTSMIRGNIIIDEFIIMPNHLHGIIIIDSVGAHCNVPLHEQTEKFGCSTKNSIPTIVKLFKSTTTKQINGLRQSLGVPVWQRSYYEHVIRNDKDLNQIRGYIINNPLTWQDDEDNPINMRGTLQRAITF